MEKTEITESEKRWKERFQVFENMFKLKENLSGSKKHLDFGCGIGTFTKILAEKYPNIQIVGVDVDKEKIKIAKRYKLPNLRFLCSTKISGKFDSITSLLTLHEISGNVQKTLEELYNHLNKNGRIMVYEFRKRSKAKYKEWYIRGKMKHSFEEEYRKHNKWTVKKFEQMCKNAGFKTVKIQPVGDFWLLYIGAK